MNKKEIRYAFNTVLEAAAKIKCSDLHHPKKWQHGSDEICPAEYHLHRQMHIVELFMKERINE